MLVLWMKMSQELLVGRMVSSPFPYFDGMGLYYSLAAAIIWFIP